MHFSLAPSVSASWNRIRRAEQMCYLNKGVGAEGSLESNVRLLS